MSQFGIRGKPRCSAPVAAAKKVTKKIIKTKAATVPMATHFNKPVVLPLARPPSARTFHEGNWLDTLAKEIGHAKKILLCSYMYDDGAIQKALVRRLSVKDGFSCTLVLDKNAHRQANCKTQAKKVDELLARGAQVYLTTGKGGFNSYDGAQHRKGAVLDDDVVWSGSSNLTRASRANLELVHRFQNCDAADETERLLRQALRGAVMLKDRR